MMLDNVLEEVEEMLAEEYDMLDEVEEMLAEEYEMLADELEDGVSLIQGNIFPQHTRCLGFLLVVVERHRTLRIGNVEML